MSVGGHKPLLLMAQAKTWEEKKATVLSWLQPDEKFMEKLQRSFTNAGAEGKFWADLSVTDHHVNNPSDSRKNHLQLMCRLA